MNDSMLNLVSVYSTNNEEYEKKKFINEEYKIFKDTLKNTMNIYFKSKAFWNFVCILVFILLNYYIYQSYLDKKINIEKLVSTFTLTYSVLRFYENAPYVSNHLSKLYSEIRDIETFMEQISNVNINSKKKPNKLFVNGDIEFINVYHKYKDTFVLDNISFKIKKGEKVALIGPIGSGKSTSVKLLLGFQPLLLGTIKINNIDINDIPNQELRQNIFYIPQKPKLFNRTLYENIVYGLKEPPSEEDIISLLKNLQLDDLIDIFREKMNFKLGLDGNKLSGGQKQIVWLLRSFYHKSKVIVMDEPTSALDKENKGLMIRNIKKLSIGKTLIIITHDDIQSDFRKIHFKDGKIKDGYFFLQ
jgi:ABC-type multidrug transport system fused ATPase/permease subunit